MLGIVDEKLRSKGAVLSQLHIVAQKQTFNLNASAAICGKVSLNP